MKQTIPLFKNKSTSEHVRKVTDVILRGKYWANGPEVKEFENQISKYIGVKYCLVFNSGTSAGHALMHAHNLSDSEVIVPSFTFIATSNVVLMGRGTPIFADVEPNSFGLDILDVEAKITEKTKAIMPIHYGGMPCDILKLKKLAADRKLLLIEDAAESMGATFDGKKVGSFGDSAWFSFTPTKVISTGEGGAIVTNNREVFERAKLFRSHGRLETEEYFSSFETMDYISLGYNFRMSSLTAALGLSQLEIIEELIDSRINCANNYKTLLEDIDSVILPKQIKGRKNIHQMYTIKIKEGRNKRDSLQKFLNDNGITSRVYFEPVHKTHFYHKDLRDESVLLQTDNLSDMVLSLPIYPDLEFSQQEYISLKIREFFN